MILPHLGHQLHPGSDDSTGETSPPRDWSHRLQPRPTGRANTRWEVPWSNAQSLISSMAQAPPGLFTTQPRLRTQNQLTDSSEAGQTQRDQGICSSHTHSKSGSFQVLCGSSHPNPERLGHLHKVAQLRHGRDGSLKLAHDS